MNDRSYSSYSSLVFFFRWWSLHHDLQITSEAPCRHGMKQWSSAQLPTCRTHLAGHLRPSKDDQIQMDAESVWKSVWKQKLNGSNRIKTWRNRSSQSWCQLFSSVWIQLSPWPLPRLHLAGGWDEVLTEKAELAATGKQCWMLSDKQIRILSWGGVNVAYTLGYPFLHWQWAPVEDTKIAPKNMAQKMFLLQMNVPKTEGTDKFPLYFWAALHTTHIHKGTKKVV